MLLNVTSALIAGGQSRRFGSSKLLARFKDKRLIDHALNIASAISPDTILIGDSPSATEAEGVPIYKDIIPGCGPLGGVYTALYYARQKYVAILPADMPLLAVDVYRFLYPSCTQERPVVAFSHKGLEPLVSIWPVTILAELEKSIKNRQYSLHKLLQNLNAKEIELEAYMPNYQQHWFKNINYKEDLNFIKTRHAKSLPVNIE